jgi:hypothetical protein
MLTYDEQSAQLSQLDEYQAGVKQLEASGITEAYECKIT